MKKHQIPSPQTRALLFDPPSDPSSIVRQYTLSPEDIATVRRRRRDANRLRFAVSLALLRFPGRVIGPSERPPSDMLRFQGEQIGLAPAAPSRTSGPAIAIDRITHRRRPVCSVRKSYSRSFAKSRIPGTPRSSFRLQEGGQRATAHPCRQRWCNRQILAGKGGFGENLRLFGCRTGRIARARAPAPSRFFGGVAWVLWQ